MPNTFKDGVYYFTEDIFKQLLHTFQGKTLGKDVTFDLLMNTFFENSNMDIVIKEKEIKPKIINAISLFSGMGGDSLGIHNSGINLIAYSEIEKEFQKTHELNFPESKFQRNTTCFSRNHS